MNALNQLKGLKPQNEREALLYTKAYLEAIEATITAMEKFGLDQVRRLHDKVVADLEKKIEHSLGL